VVGADPASFKVIGYGYGRDAKRVYCGTVPMAVEMPDDFEILSKGEPGSTNDRATFLRLFGQAFAHLEISKYHPVQTCEAWGRDGKHYYHGPSRVEGADYESFRIIDKFNAADKNRKYWRSFVAKE
jgi:hypothetical protein